MNLYKIALSLLVTAAPAAARLSSDEKDSSAMMRELMAKVDALNSKVTSLEADNKSLKNEVASLKGLLDMSALDGMELPDMSDINVTDLAGLLGVEVDPSSGGGPLYDLLAGITSTLLGITNCVGFELEFEDRRRLSSKRRLEGYGYEPIPICFFGNQDVNVVIEANWEDGFIELDAGFIGDFSIEREIVTRELLIDSSDSNFGGQAASAEEKKAALKAKKDEFIAKHSGGN